MDNGGESVLNIIHNDDGGPANVNISDVIEAITRADPVFGADVDAMSRPPAALGAHPCVRIVEQPASKALRFRYECEGRSAGSIPGVNSTPERKTYPTIEICGHRGPAVVVVSCVTREEPFKPHPHNLVGRERCDKGVCTVRTSVGDDSRVSFSNLGIQCVKRKDIADALKTREQLRVDPFKTGFGHRNQPQSIDLNAVRLCFQVFIQDERTGKVRHSLPPVVSDIIYDKKAMSDLVIMRMSQCSATPRGGTEIFLLCEKVVREDIAVVFFQKEGDAVVWEESANIVLVHKQVAIAFHAPPYQNPHATHNVQVYIQLKRTSDNARSNAVPFEYIPDYQDSGYLKHKRQKILSSLMQYDERNYVDPQIKSEPRDKTPPHAMGSPRRVASVYNEHEPVQDNTYQQWNMQNVPLAGPSHIQPYQDVQWGQNYTQLSPSVPTMSPNEASMSPNMQMSPMGPTSPIMRASPMAQVMSPISPMHGAISPNMHQMTTLGHVSPNLGHMGHNMIPQQVQNQQMPQQDLMETVSDSPSITSLLMDREDIQLLSADLSGLVSLLPAQNRGPDLSDSLNRLSTSELYPS
ncbi:embryonic polarity protein dorsal isoform X2 [Zerene cesonia]|uniref:embryonic polarity protein dorsal isoform X2 n=1 Tax=Zerene cesonia TaxID=33412 RepID=UPI0018E5A7B3|nr:embryonic polarity protein dorsal isoform X2 [Zerene cesonia]